MLYLKGQCSGVISTTLVMIAFSKMQSCHYQLSEKKDPQATTYTYLNLKFTLSSCFQRGKNVHTINARKGQCKPGGTHFYIMYHRHNFMFYFHCFKKQHSLHLVIHLFASYHQPWDWPPCLPLNVLWLIESRRMLMHQFQFYKKTNWEKKTARPRKKRKKKKPSEPSLLSTHMFIDINIILPLMGKMTEGHTSGLMLRSLCNSINFRGQGGCNPMQKLLIMAF